jgi:hypothetical protein
MSSAGVRTILLRKSFVREEFEQITKTPKFEMSQSNPPGSVKRHNCWSVRMPSGRTEYVNLKHDFVLSVCRDVGST